MADIRQQIVFGFVVEPDGAVRGMDRVGKAAQRMDEQIESAAQSTHKLAKTSTVNAAPAMLSLNQMLGDSQQFAFGFANGTRAIANNVEMATTQFVMLNRQTGGAVNTLKAMVGSLTGPMGILMAINAVMLVVVTFGDKIAAAFTRGSEKSEEFLESLKSIAAKMTEIADQPDRKLLFGSLAEAEAGLAKLEKHNELLRQNQDLLREYRKVQRESGITGPASEKHWREEISNREDQIAANEALAESVREEIDYYRGMVAMERAAIDAGLDLTKTTDDTTRALRRQAQAVREVGEEWRGIIPFMRGKTQKQRQSAWQVGVAADAREGAVATLGPMVEESAPKLREVEAVNNQITKSANDARSAYMALGLAAGNVMGAMMKEADTLAEKVSNVAQAVIQAVQQFMVARISMQAAQGSMALGPAGLAIAGIAAGGALLSGLFSRNASRTEERIRGGDLVRVTDWDLSLRAVAN